MRHAASFVLRPFWLRKGNLHVLLALSGEISVCNEIGYEKDRNALFRSFYVVETDLSGHS